MERMSVWGAGLLMLAATPFAVGDELSESPFFKDSKTQLLNRNFFFNRDFRDNASTAQSYRQEWAQGLIGTFNSGFTEGTVGFGIDLLGMYGLKLDSSSDRINSGLLPSSGNHVAGVDHAQNDYSKATGAIKIKVSNTVLKYGGQSVATPVFATADSRLLPETVEGFFLSSKEVKDLTVEAGHFTSMTLQAYARRPGSALTGADILGASYKLTPTLTASLYGSSVKDYWKKRYAALAWVKPLDDLQTVSLDLRAYDLKSQGEEKAGELDNQSFSLKGAYRYAGSTFSLANQQIHGRGAFQLYVDGTNTDYLSNYIQYAEFTRENERSWQARYDFNFASIGVPGLTFMTRYVRGDNFSASAGQDDREWERDIEMGYVVQSGPAKNLSFRMRQATYRNSFNGSLDEVRLITEYPLNW